MGFDELPPEAAWRHHGEQRGFEVVRLAANQRDPAGGFVAEGHIAGFTDRILATTYDLTVGADGTSRRAVVSAMDRDGTRRIELVGDGLGRWTLDGAPCPIVDGCLDVDLETSAFTNALPIRRLASAIGVQVDAPAVYVRADLTVERLEQSYRRLEDDLRGPHLASVRSRYDYRAPAFDFQVEITYDAAGLVVDYPWIGTRADLPCEDPAGDASAIR